MNLYRIEYQIRSTGQRLICHSVGVSQDDVMNDISSVAGEITVMNLCYVCAVHRLSKQLQARLTSHLSHRMKKFGIRQFPQSKGRICDQE
jgi:hypothetical protein